MWARTVGNHNGLGTLIGLAVCVIGALYLMIDPRNLFAGDGYINLQYARNLATGYGWSFNAGEPTFATTSPLWVLCLSLLYLSYPNPDAFVLFASLLGLALFAVSMLIYHRIAAAWSQNRAAATLAVLLFVLIPFNGLFYAISAMETGLYLALFFGFLRLIRTSRSTNLFHVVVGLWGGALFLTRPEGALCPAVYWIASLTGPNWCRRLRSSAGAFGMILIGFLLIAAPWEWFLYTHSGRWLPTSGRGRLYGYLDLVYPGLTLRQYLEASVWDKVQLIPQVLKTQFFSRPDILVLCLLPYLLLVLSAVTSRLHDGSSWADARLAVFLLTYCSLNLVTYMVFQPLVFQRYFVTLLPSSLLCAVVYESPRVVVPKRLTAWNLSAVLVLAAIASAPGFLQYQRHMNVGAELRAVLDAVGSRSGPCRLAAEPLGYAGYFTRCYVIDLGGLINPDIWDYWLSEKTGVDYAADKKADFIVSARPLPSEHAGRFQLMQRVARWAIYASVQSRDDSGPRGSR